jgi:hypothetical protein
LKSVGVGLATAAWVSVLTAHLQLPTDVRTYAGIGCSLLATAVAQVFLGRPPSMDLLEVLRLLERDLLAVAREFCPTPGDPDAVRVVATRIAAQAATALQHSGRVPRDARAWFRALAAGESYQT